ncbi:MAG: ATP-binding cassette domain-containing protein [Bacteroidota bacterium]
MEKLSPAPLTPLQRFWRLLQPDKREIREVYLFAIFNGLVNLSLPLGIQAIVNLIQGGQVSTSWIVLVVIVVLGVAITGVLQIFQLRITENLQQKIFTRAAFEFAYRLPRIKMEALYRHYAPELMNRFFDTMSVQKGLSKILIDFSSALLQLVFGLLLLSFYHSFFLVFSAAMILLVYLIIRLTVNRGLQTSLAESKHKYKVAYWLEELARTNMTFKLAGDTQMPLRRVDNHVQDYLGAREKHFGVLVRQYILLVVFKVLVATGLLAIGGILVMEQQMNIGQFVAAEIIILLVMSSVEKLVMSMETIYDVLTSLEKIGQVTDLSLEQDTGLDIAQVCQQRGLGVELEHVTFRFPEGNKDVLEGLTLTLKAGEKWMLAGPNGAGKSTLLKIIGGLYEIQDGNISFHGYPKGNLDLAALRSNIGDRLADQELFEGSVLENIKVGRPNISFDHVSQLMRELGLQAFIRQLPQGFESILDPQGQRLPRSVVQKLLLARAMAGEPKLLLLEDAFEHIDQTERHRIIDFVTDPRHPWTLVAVSSDPYLALQIQKMAILEHGRIKNQGLASDLMAAAFT